jgi:hypothetical protein
MSGKKFLSLHECSCFCFLHDKPGVAMLWTIILILLIGWALGFFAFNVGSLIHLLLVIAVIVFIINLVSGRRAV